MLRNHKLLFFVVLLLAGSSSWAQNNNKQKYWVFLTDKDGVEFNPYSYFDSKAIERREKANISLYDPSDFPVKEKYIQGIKNTGAQIKVVSRWFNALVVYADKYELELIQKQVYVKEVISDLKPLKQISGQDHNKIIKFVLSKDKADLVKAQLKRMGAPDFEEAKIDGSGMRIAVFDVGFKSYKSNPAFNHLRASNSILKTWDFVKNKENVDGFGTHGTNVLSCIAGKAGYLNIGMATGAEFLLARTETWTEFFSEEENWLAAAEWADKNGADIINSSLGYTYHRYFRSDMNGKTAFVSRAANMAARKGILVVNAAGNEGSDSWKNIGAPADADSVLTVGGIHPRTGIHTSFSSFGPTWDKRLKPNVSAYGHVIASGPKGYHKTQGTSFSSPLTAGFAACAWQMNKELTNMEIFALIEKSGDLYPYYDYAHGYGVPQANFFLKKGAKDQIAQIIGFSENGSHIQITLDSGLHRIHEKKDSVIRRTEIPDNLFYHIENKRGYLDKYFVVNLYSDTDTVHGPIVKGDTAIWIYPRVNALSIDKNNHQLPFTIRVFYRGSYNTILVDQ